MKFITIAAIILLIAVVAVQAHTITNFDDGSIFKTEECATLEQQVRLMNEDEINKLMIVTAEVLTEHYKEETRAQVEEEHTAYANRLALEHMNDVMGVLIKSIGAMPTSTISN